MHPESGELSFDEFKFHFLVGNIILKKIIKRSVYIQVMKSI